MSLADLSTTESYLNSGSPPSSKIYEESILMDNILPNVIGAIMVFFMLLILLSTDLVSTSYSAAGVAERAKLSGFLALFITSLVSFIFGIYRYFRKSGTKPNLNVVWIYGVILLVLILVLLTTEVFKT